MSYRLLKEDVLFAQRLLRAQGLYRDALDGRWGPRTQAAADEFERRSLALRAEFGGFDARSEANILGLALVAQAHARRFLHRVRAHGFDARILSGTRTYAQQNALFRQGRFGNPGPIVTRARAGRSHHNFGIAWDIGLFTAEHGYSRRVSDYAEAARVGRDDALEWGGDWPSFPDPPHYQLAGAPPLAQLRDRFERGAWVV